MKGHLRLVWMVTGLLTGSWVMVCTSAQAAIHLQTVVGGLTAPVYITPAPDQSGRLFVVEQGGTIRILADTSLLPQPYLDIRNHVRAGGEMGLLGLAFHPDYANNGRFFVNYTRDGIGSLETVIAEYSVSPGDANVAVKESERILLTISQPFENHNGGMIAFGPDEFLYIATGDGGSGGDPQGNASNLNTLLGKILRLDVDTGTPYAIPLDNPFAALPGRDEIWAYGLRNPWRFSFDRETGRLIAGDVGQNRREEIDIIERGGNYGWNTMEGNLCFSPPSNCTRTGLILPIHDYDRNQGSSVTGGYLYRGSQIHSMVGKYIFSDFGSGRLGALSETSDGQWRHEELLATGLNVSSFGEDASGELYLVNYGGTVLRIVSDGGEPTVSVGGVVNAASFLNGPVAPGEIVAVFGASLGPEALVGAQLDEFGRLEHLLEQTRVWFDGWPAPLFAARSDQVNAQVPYGVEGRTSTVMQVQVGDALSNPVRLDVAVSTPGLFALASGRGPGAVLNENLSLNSATNPATGGSVVALFATGQGQIDPPGVDGQLSTIPYPTPQLPVSILIGGMAAEIQFAGMAPGFAGLLQVNAVVPQNVSPGNSVPPSAACGPGEQPARRDVGGQLGDPFPGQK
jgi:uncharacterized protein (TIGR03437 family)